jgi:hypothetical protein
MKNQIFILTAHVTLRQFKAWNCALTKSTICTALSNTDLSEFGILFNYQCMCAKCNGYTFTHFGYSFHRIHDSYSFACHWRHTISTNINTFVPPNLVVCNKADLKSQKCLHLFSMPQPSCRVIYLPETDPHEHTRKEQTQL